MFRISCASSQQRRLGRSAVSTPAFRRLLLSRRLCHFIYQCLIRKQRHRNLQFMPYVGGAVHRPRRFHCFSHAETLQFYLLLSLSSTFILLQILSCDVLKSALLFVDQSAVDPGQREDERVPLQPQRLGGGHRPDSIRQLARR